MRKMQMVGLLVLLLLRSVPFSVAAGAVGIGQFDGVGRVGIYVDVNVADSRALAKRMMLLEETLRQVRELVADVDVVIGFRGGASRYLTRYDQHLLEEELADRELVQRAVMSFLGQGAVVEQCAIAAEQQGLVPDGFIDGVRIVPNGYVAMIAYQTKGYALLPMD